MNAYLTDVERVILEGATVGIAGAGGLGSNCAMHLARAGVRSFVIVDFDTVSESNLNRQFFFRDQVGMKKVDALRENLLRIEPGLMLKTIDARLDESNAIGIFKNCDIVVEALDGADTKAMFVSKMIDAGKRTVAASGMAGWGMSNEMRVRRVGANLFLVGDGQSGVSEDCAPQSPRVGIAAAMEANAVIAMLLQKEP